MSTTNIEVDATTRFLDGDWAEHTIDTLRVSGLLVRDATQQFWVCPATGERYTIGCLQQAHLQARHMRQTATRTARMRA